MKLTIILSLLLFATQTRAQKLTGLLMGEVTRMPVVNAKVTAGNGSVLSNPSGVFVIGVPARTDSIRITAAGYAPYAFKPSINNRADTVVIYVKPTAYNLKEVSIKGKRNLKADSLRLRKDFGAVFKYKAPNVTSVLYKRPPPSKLILYDYITAPNNATAIVGVDLLSVAGLFSKNKTQKSRLQTILLKEEADNYADKTFAKQKVIDITGLKGDALQTFMDKYRPTNAQLSKMTDYELMLYIKNSYGVFAGGK